MVAPVELLAPMTPWTARVLGRRRETPDSVTLAMEWTGEPVEPGRFNMLYAFGIGEVPISLAGAGRNRVLHTVRAVGAVTDAISAAGRGTVLGVRGPFGRGWGIAEAEGADLVLVGGGIGLAPLRGAVEAVLRRRDRYGRVAILAGARSPENMPFRRELREWSKRGDVQVLTTVDTAGPSWTGPVGLVTDLIPPLRIDPGSTLALVCGPEVMMRFVAAALIERGLDATRIRVSMERNMKCAIGHCGRCQLGPSFVCKDGPVFRHADVAGLLAIGDV